MSGNTTFTRRSMLISSIGMVALPAISGCTSADITKLSDKGSKLLLASLQWFRGAMGFDGEPNTTIAEHNWKNPSTTVSANGYIISKAMINDDTSPAILADGLREGGDEFLNQYFHQFDESVIPDKHIPPGKSITVSSTVGKRMPVGTIIIVLQSGLATYTPSRAPYIRPLYITERQRS